MPGFPAPIFSNPELRRRGYLIAVIIFRKIATEIFSACELAHTRRFNGSPGAGEMFVPCRQ